VVHYLPDQDKWVRYTMKDGLVSDHVRSITTVDDGDVWFAADGGASYWDGTRFLSYTTADGLVGDNVYKVAQAPDHSIWFATDEGASHYIPSTNTWISYTTKEGLAGDFVKYVAITPDGSVWLPTLLDGLSRLILPSGNEAPIWITYSPYVEGENKIPLDFIDQIQVGPDGRYWFAGLGGFMQYDPKTKTWLADNKYSEVGGQINSFTFGPDGSIWIASGSATPVVYHSSLNGQNVWEIYDSRDGIPTINKPDVNEDRAEAIAVPSADIFWVATFEKATRCVLSK
jgi:ligand-binding sensor domain-containing protein